MLKRILFTALCTVAVATSGYAVELKINAAVEAYYKIQTDYDTPLDSTDEVATRSGSYDADSGANDRSGANNRSHQKVRAHGTVDFIGLSGENDYNGTTWYNFIGFMRLELDANDPDNNYGSDLEKDGSYADKTDIGDLWIRYSPAAMVGIKIGTQTVLATANAYGIGHKFVGDKDDDYIYYTASALDEKPGLTIDFHLSKDIELGVGMIQGMGDLSQIITGGDSAQANTTVAWFKGTFGMIEATVGHQSLAVGDTENESDDPDAVLAQWQHEYKHTVLNAVLKVNIGDFSPFFGYQSASGDMVEARSANFAGLAETFNTFAAAGLPIDTINNTLTTQDVKLTSMTLGLLANLGPGKLAAEYTIMSTPEWGEDGYATAAIEANSTIHINYEFPISEDASISAFYNSFTAKEDSKLRDDIAAMTDEDGTNSAALNTAEALTLIDAATKAQLLAGMASSAESLPAGTATSHSSLGVSFQMKFGN